MLIKFQKVIILIPTVFLEKGLVFQKSHLLFQQHGVKREGVTVHTQIQ